ncbi:MAG: NUDIX domain-containing protein [Nocardioides sp.]
MTESVSIHTVTDGVARVTWTAEVVELGLVEAVGRVQPHVDGALAEHGRVEAWVRPEDVAGQRLATWAGLRREGVMRGAVAEGDRIVFARLAGDPPSSEPEGFRALLNSFLPRKRAISQLLVRDHAGRVLLCQLTYKPDWDLPGGVVEVGESPQLAVSREVSEELGLELPAGPLLLTDWLPPWSGWDDALCLVFDGGRHDPTLLDSVVREKREIRAAEFCTPEQAADRCAEFTSRRVRAALANVDGTAPAYAESGHLREAPT